MCERARFVSSFFAEFASSRIRQFRHPRTILKSQPQTGHTRFEDLGTSVGEIVCYSASLLEHTEHTELAEHNEQTMGMLSLLCAELNEDHEHNEQAEHAQLAHCAHDPH